MFGFSSGDLMTLDDERHLFVSVVSGWLRPCSNFLNPFAFITFRPEHFLYFCPYLNEAAVTDDGRRCMMLLWMSESNLI
ncbi:MAG: hypothetical protein E7J73_08655 [Veillonella sp.]|nr:hypothetical protein [Veillonella sp.]